MNSLLIKNVNVVLPYTVLENSWVLVEEGRIVAVGVADATLPTCHADTRELDGEGGYVVAGFIDIHVHGGAGGDFMTAKEEELHTITRFHMEQGTTTMLATTVTAS